MVETIRSRSKPISLSKSIKDTGDIELDEKTPSPGLVGGWESPRSSFISTSAERHVDFDFPRMIRFMGYGFCFAPIAVDSLFTDNVDL